MNNHLLSEKSDMMKEFSSENLSKVDVEEYYSHDTTLITKPEPNLQFVSQYLCFQNEGYFDIDQI